MRVLRAVKINRLPPFRNDDQHAAIGVDQVRLCSRRQLKDKVCGVRGELQATIDFGDDDFQWFHHQLELIAVKRKLF